MYTTQSHCWWNKRRYEVLKLYDHEINICGSAWSSDTVKYEIFASIQILLCLLEIVKISLKTHVTMYQIIDCELYMRTMFIDQWIAKISCTSILFMLKLKSIQWLHNKKIVLKETINRTLWWNLNKWPVEPFHQDKFEINNYNLKTCKKIFFRPFLIYTVNL
jgi:hypothetical protein